MLMLKKQLLISVIMVGISISPTYAAQVCLDRDEFAGLIQRVEQTAKELANIKAQVSLYQKANEARKEELRVSSEYMVSLEHYKDLSEELLAAYERREAEHVKELDAATWWRNVGWGTAVIVTVGAMIMGVLK